NNPPDALATYQTLTFLGSMSISEMRPVVMSGPIVRSGNPLILSDVRPDRWAPPAAQAAATARLRASVRFMAGHSRTSEVARGEFGCSIERWVEQGFACPPSASARGQSAA